MRSETVECHYDTIFGRAGCWTYNDAAQKWTGVAMATTTPKLVFGPGTTEGYSPLYYTGVNPQSDMASYRVVNSRKCIRVRGKHNDLDDVGNDLYHHTFFEMLGNWSFGDYFKKEACTMTWDLLTNVYGLPQRHLYVTYFGGNEAAGLKTWNTETSGCRLG
ncbi:Alanine--tRNA ligase, cytoplasmic [Lamellibrachia satsuma]|nr:Alanine--tRNA ligase, cytoplasmic [Lamellibrachia satsuma]